MGPLEWALVATASACVAGMVTDGAAAYAPLLPLDQSRQHASSDSSDAAVVSMHSLRSGNACRHQAFTFPFFDA